MADRHGGVVVLEFLDGRMVARTGPELCAAALTNSTYEDSCQLWESLRPAGNYNQQNNSIHRFCLAADRVQEFQPGTTAHSVGYAFDTLHQVRGQLWGGNTRWSIVFDTSNLRAYFRTERNPDDITALIGLFESYPCAQTRRSPGRRIAPAR